MEQDPRLLEHSEEIPATAGSSNEERNSRMVTEITGRSLSRRLVGLPACLIFAVAMILGSVVAWQTWRRGVAEIDQLEQNMLENRKKALEKQVNLAWTIVNSNFQRASTTEFIIARFGPRLQNVVESAEALIRVQIQAVKAGRKDVRQAQKAAIEQLRSLRYAGGSGYVWVNDMGEPYPKMVMHPIVPSLEGKVMDDPKYNCTPDGGNLFQAFVKVCKTKGAGFVRYKWPKPAKDGLKEETPKLSFVKLVPEWNWVIGTGVYVDDVMREARHQALDVLRNIGWDGGKGYFWVNDMSEPYPKMVMHPTVPSLEGKVLDDPKYNCTPDGGNLFKESVKVCKAKGAGFVRYKWPKPAKDGLTKETPKLSFVRLFKPYGWVIGTGVYLDDIEAAVNRQTRQIRQELIHELVLIGLLSFSAALVGAFLLYYFVAKPVVNPLRTMFKVVAALGEGAVSRAHELICQMQVPRVDTLRKLHGILQTMTASFLERINSLSAMGKGDFTNEVKVLSEADEFGTAMVNVRRNLVQTLETLLHVSHEVKEGSLQLESASTALSQLSTEQAASVEEINSSLTEVSGQARKNSESAGQMAQLTRDASGQAESGYQ
ncbi:MAG: methyl-accepting chemotaxis protein, partial [Lentisphaerae bacterium]